MPIQARNKIKNAIFILVLGAGLVYLYFEGPRLQSFRDINVLEIALPLMLSVLGYLVLGLSFKFLLCILNVSLPFKEWFGLTVVNTMFNYYLPARGGTVIKAYYLKKKYGLSYPHYAALTAASILLWLASTSLVGLVAVLFASAIIGRFILSLAVAFFSLFLGVFLMGLITTKLLGLKIHSKFVSLNLVLVNLKDGLTSFWEHKKYALDFCLLSLALLLTTAARLYFCFVALGFSVKYWAILLIMAVTELSFLISVIPGNLAVKEGIIVFSGGFFGISAGQALAAAILDRAISLVVIFGFGIIYSKILLHKMDAK